MNKKQLIEAVAAETGQTKASTGRMIDVIMDNIAKGLRRDGHVALAGFGTFIRRIRRAHTGIHPISGKPMKVKSQKTVSFRPSPMLRRGL